MAQLGRAHPGFESLGFSAGNFAIDQQTKPFGVAEICGTILGLEVGEGFGHTVQP